MTSTQCATFLVSLWNPTAAGSPKVTAALVEALHGAGHRVIVAHGPPSTDSAIPNVLALLAENGGELVALPRFTLAGSVITVRLLRRVIKTEDVDVVVTSQQRDRVPAVIAAATTGRVAVVMSHSLLVHAGNRILVGLKSTLHRMLMRRWATLAICVSPAVQDQVINMGVPPGRTRLLYNAVDFHEISTRANRVRSREGARPRVLLNVARLSETKGQDVLVRAAVPLVEHDRDWRLSFAGVALRGDSYAESLEQLVTTNDLTDRVRFLGWRRDVPELLGACDVYVHPSRVEGWPLAVCEAMAAGCAIVMSDCVGRPPGFTDGVHGMVVAAGSVDDLRNALRWALELTDSELRTIGESAQRYAADRYSIEEWRKQLLAIMIDGRGKGSP